MGETWDTVGLLRAEGIEGIGCEELTDLCGR